MCEGIVKVSKDFPITKFCAMHGICLKWEITAGIGLLAIDEDWGDRRDQYGKVFEFISTY